MCVFVANTARFIQDLLKLQLAMMMMWKLRKKSERRLHKFVCTLKCTKPQSTRAPTLIRKIASPKNARWQREQFITSIKEVETTFKINYTQGKPIIMYAESDIFFCNNRLGLKNMAFFSFCLSSTIVTFMDIMVERVLVWVRNGHVNSIRKWFFSSLLFSCLLSCV